MAKQAVVIGLGRFGISLAQELYHLGFDVLGIDKSEQVVKDLEGQLTTVVQGDSTSESVLRDLGIASYDLAIVSIGGDIEASILTTLLVKGLGIPQVVARSNNPLHARALEHSGADKVINPEQDAGVRLAHALFNPDVQDYLSVTSTFGISRFHPPERLTGMTLEEVGLGGTRDRYGIIVLAIRRGREPILLPAKDEIIAKGDILFVAGRDDMLDKVRRGEPPTSHPSVAPREGAATRSP
ncbi:MAG: TrkA family potassium uptake protein [Chloroflexi bacterium]|nr:TrkA family potassium uptake protein [Chloroflexota bacterium]